MVRRSATTPDRRSPHGRHETDAIPPANPYALRPADDAQPEGDGSTSVDRLDADECWPLLASRELGRLALVGEEGLPELFPVNYVVRHERVYLRSAPGSKLIELVARPDIAFEVDGMDDGSHWSVVIRGFAVRLDTDSEIEDSGVLDLRSWNPTDKQNFIRLTPVSISGRRFPMIEQTNPERTGVSDETPRRAARVDMVRSWCVRLLVAATFFNALSALGGGIALLMTNGLGMPRSLLADGPFTSFVWPALLLIGIVGGTQSAAAILLTVGREAALLWSAVAGFGMVIWIMIETALIHGFSWLQALYFASGLLQPVLVVVLLGVVTGLPRRPLRSLRSRSAAHTRGRAK